MRREEQYAAAMIEAALHVPVVEHDDGSADGLYDLDAGDFAAIEVTTATDSDSQALWKLFNGSEGRWIEPDLTGAWIVSLRPTARAKDVRRALPGLLSDWASKGREQYRDEGWGGPEVDPDAARLGVESATWSPTTEYPGCIYILLSRDHELTGGVVGDNGDGLVDWIVPWVSDPARSDNLLKLRGTTRRERHLFVFLPAWTSAPFSAADVLHRAGGAPLPKTPPQLPDPLTHLWVASGWSVPFGLRWSRAPGWERFNQLQPD